MEPTEAPIRESSPSQTAISESKLFKKGLCDYVINVADGCTHGCSFCYVPSMPSIWGDPGDKFADAGIDDPSDDWGGYALYRDDVVENTARDCQRLLPEKWRVTGRGGGVVGISFGTDCYMDPRAGELTQGVVNTLVGHDRVARILTRNPKLLADLHGEFYEALPAGAVTIGSSIPTLNVEDAAAIEPGAPPIGYRIRGLASLDVPTFVSMSPTYPTQGYDEIEALLRELKREIEPTVVFHEPINPRSGNFEKCVDSARLAGQDDLAGELDRLRDAEHWRRYALRQLRDAQLAAEEVGQLIHLWPDERLLPSLDDDGQPENPTLAEAWCQAWRERPTPEAMGESPACVDPYPDVPEIDTTEQGELGRFGSEKTNKEESA